jgi:hypothetical protein
MTVKGQKGFGDLMRKNKGLLNASMARLGIKPERRALIVAVAMQETNAMSEFERDWTKFDKPEEANFTILNLNADMIKRVTGRYPEAELNSMRRIGEAVAIIDRAIDMKAEEWKCEHPPKHLGVRGVLNYIRGGYEAFEDGKQYDAPKYRSAIKTIVTRFDGDPNLMTDYRRVAIQIEHVVTQKKAIVQAVRVR